jgi:hypothetical protein
MQFPSLGVAAQQGLPSTPRPDRNAVRGQRLIDHLRADTDGRVTFFAKRVDASNEGQSWFTKEWGVPHFAPGLKVVLVPRCPALAAPPAATPMTQGQSATITAVVRGQGPMTFRWRRNGVDISDGPGGASPGGGVVAGAAGQLPDPLEGAPVSLTIAGVRGSDAGDYALVLTNACGGVTSPAAALAVTVPCRADLNNDGELTFDDVQLFVSLYNANDPGADINGDQEWTFDDIQAFIALYNAGC